MIKKENGEYITSQQVRNNFPDHILLITYKNNKKKRKEGYLMYSSDAKTLLRRLKDLKELNRILEDEYKGDGLVFVGEDPKFFEKIMWLPH